METEKKVKCLRIYHKEFKDFLFFISIRIRRDGSLKTRGELGFVNKKEKNFRSIEYRKKNKIKMKELVNKWQKHNPDKVNEYAKRWRDRNPEVQKANNKKWIENNREKFLELVKKSVHKRRRNLGFIPLNKHFENSEGHHINTNFIIYIPKKLHRSIYHNIWTGKGMDEINNKVFIWLGLVFKCNLNK
ncbi:MAG: hypothetical protein KAX49_03800 [Halanaerobiales bacterium]|nr:hypothetical protein [Halanaerobiales bacterium]